MVLTGLQSARRVAPLESKNGRTVTRYGLNQTRTSDYDRPRRLKEALMNFAANWTFYRTRFLVRARQLTDPLSFTDVLGREQTGRTGDYLVESSDGITRVMSQAIFEDIYVPLATQQTYPQNAERAPGIPSIGAGQTLARPLARGAPEGRTSATA
jgi:hypothetical protein